MLFVTLPDFMWKISRGRKGETGHGLPSVFSGFTPIKTSHATSKYGIIKMASPPGVQKRKCAEACVLYKHE